MKRVFVVLLLGMTILYAREGYNTYLSAYHIKERITGFLSDIAKEVIAIPLQSANGKAMAKVRDIRIDRNDLFLVSDDILFRYNKDGQFICQITDLRDMKVAGYLIDPVKSELIVLGNTDDIFYYSYKGDLIEKRKMEGDLSNQRVFSMSLHNNRILSIEENCYVHPDTQEILVEKELVSYDTSFQKMESQKLDFVDFGRGRYLLALTQPQLCINPDTGGLFVYNPPKEYDYLYQDTLRLTTSWNQYVKIAGEYQSIPAVPVRPAGRFWISSCSGFEEKERNFTFCYDTQSHEYKKLKDGFADDFYETGTIPNLQSMDFSNQSFCFTQSGEATKKAFPDSYSSGNAVVFIVHLSGLSAVAIGADPT